MAQWIRIIPIPLAVSVLALVIRICRSLVVPTITSSPAVAENIAESSWAICLTAISARRTSTPESKRKTVEQFYLDMRHVQLFIDTLTHSSDATVTQLKNFASGHEMKLFQVCTLALEIVRGSDVPPSLKEELDGMAGTFSHYGASLHTMFSMTVDQPYLHPDIFTALHKEVRSVSTPLSAMCYMLSFVKDTQKCFALGCPKSLQTPGATFQKCGGCRIVGYCGRDCQKRAWSDKILAHKAVCNKARDMVELGGGRVDDKDELAQNLRQAKVKDEDVEAVLNWFKAWFALTSPVDLGTERPDEGFFDFASMAI